MMWALGAPAPQPIKPIAAEPTLVERAASLTAAGAKLEAASSVIIVGAGAVGVELAGEILTSYPQKQVRGRARGEVHAPAAGGAVDDGRVGALRALPSAHPSIRHRPSPDTSVEPHRKLPHSSRAAHALAPRVAGDFRGHGPDDPARLCAQVRAVHDCLARGAWSQTPFGRGHRRDRLGVHHAQERCVRGVARGACVGSRATRAAGRVPRSVRLVDSRPAVEGLRSLPLLRDAHPAPPRAGEVVTADVVYKCVGVMPNTAMLKGSPFKSAFGFRDSIVVK